MILERNSKIAKLLILLLFLLSACTTTIVPYKQSREEPAHAGMQYILGIIPFGTVSIASPALAINDSLSEQLIIHRRSLGDQQLSINSVSLTAYDLIFTRRLVCSIEAELKDKDATLPINLRFTGFARFGFEKQLSAHWIRCRREFARKIVALLENQPF
jgi:hypothetical protein